MAQQEPAPTSPPSAEEVTARMWAELSQRLEAAAGPITVSGAKMAKELGISVTLFRATLKDLVDHGRLVKLAAGLSGTTLALPEMAAPSEVSASPAAAAAAEAEAEVPEGEPEAPLPAAKPRPVPARAGKRKEKPAEAAADPADGDPTPRKKVRDVLRSAVREGQGEAVVTVEHVAEVAGTSPAAAAQHIRELAKAGIVSTERAGRKGMRVRLGAQPEAPAAAQTRSAGARSTAGFCPWCGQAIGQATWRFCSGCGEALPR